VSGSLAHRAANPKEQTPEERAVAAGQIAGMIRDVRPVRDLIEDILRQAAALAVRLADLAAR